MTKSNNRWVGYVTFYGGLSTMVGPLGGPAKRVCVCVHSWREQRRSQPRLEYSLVLREKRVEFSNSTRVNLGAEH